MSVYLTERGVRMVRGDSGRLTIQCTGPDGQLRPFAEGETVVFTVKRSAQDRTAELTKTVETFTDAGEAVVEFYPEDTAELPAGPHWYDARLRTKDGAVHTILPKAEFHLLEEIGHV